MPCPIHIPTRLSVTLYQTDLQLTDESALNNKALLIYYLFFNRYKKFCLLTYPLLPQPGSIDLYEDPSTEKCSSIPMEEFVLGYRCFSAIRDGTPPPTTPMLKSPPTSGNVHLCLLDYTTMPQLPQKKSTLTCSPYIISSSFQTLQFKILSYQ